MIEEQQILDMSNLFKVLGEPTRLKILFALVEKELSVQEIADELGMSQPTISHQLRTLRQERFVINRRKGQRIFYSIYDTHVHLILEQGINHVLHDGEEDAASLHT